VLKLASRARRGRFLSTALTLLWVPYFIVHCVQCADASSVLFGCEIARAHARAAAAGEPRAANPDCHDETAAEEQACCSCVSERIGITNSASDSLVPLGLSLGLAHHVAGLLPSPTTPVAPPLAHANLGPPLHLRFARLLI